MVISGSCVGVAEELVTCGLVVEMLRDAGHAERFVVIVSSPLFAFMHMADLLSGMRGARPWRQDEQCVVLSSCPRSR
ncbi:CPBP family glutamic-type intramembrane protease [Phytohabitans houttuyneae]|uniref:CAAX prenyl protease 2/Lysostaphin resistance protein A-like domain-containing protein n=1 Tax=Phytohabitans houttuyneae TaxID=1076126 RepID=A0A6V8K567_9ACTN|nr:CPBP family glutamic-type intramembrane protease [Phytohabitans houttuyneae]GFJ77319.1 hypothetical protein Phou_014990 [Phytohabitans houttuyneae]